MKTSVKHQKRNYNSPTPLKNISFFKEDFIVFAILKQSSFTELLTCCLAVLMKLL